MTNTLIKYSPAETEVFNVGLRADRVAEILKTLSLTYDDLQSKVANLVNLQFTSLDKEANIDELKAGCYFVNWHHSADGKYPFKGTGILIHIPTTTAIQIAMYDASQGEFYVRNRPKDGVWGSWKKNSAVDLQAKIASEESARKTADAVLQEQIDASQLKNFEDYVSSYSFSLDGSSVSVSFSSYMENTPLGIYIFSPEQTVNEVSIWEDEWTELARYEGELIQGNTYIIDFQPNDENGNPASNLIHMISATSSDGTSGTTDTSGLNARITSLETNVGDITQLVINDVSNVVDAINEINEEINGIKTEIISPTQACSHTLLADAETGTVYKVRIIDGKLVLEVNE